MALQTVKKDQYWFGCMGVDSRMATALNKMATMEKILPKKEMQYLYPSTTD